jgi:hypothetical protein
MSKKLDTEGLECTERPRYLLMCVTDECYQIGLLFCANENREGKKKGKKGMQRKKGKKGMQKEEKNVRMRSFRFTRLCEALATKKTRRWLPLCRSQSQHRVMVASTRQNSRGEVDDGVLGRASTVSAGWQRRMATVKKPR